jgi:hypothetical protein
MRAMRYEDFRGAALGFIRQLAANLKEKDKVRGGAGDGVQGLCNRILSVTIHAQTGWTHHPVGSVRPRQVNKAVQYSISNT